MRRDNTALPEESTLHVNLKKIHTCLLAVACLMLMYTPAFFFMREKQFWILINKYGNKH